MSFLVSNSLVHSHLGAAWAKFSRNHNRNRFGAKDGKNLCSPDLQVLGCIIRFARREREWRNTERKGTEGRNNGKERKVRNISHNNENDNKWNRTLNLLRKVESGVTTTRRRRRRMRRRKRQKSGFRKHSHLSRI